MQLDLNALSHGSEDNLLKELATLALTEQTGNRYLMQLAISAIVEIKSLRQQLHVIKMTVGGGWDGT